MRLRNIPGADEHIESSAFVIHESKGHQGQWKSEVFQADRPLFLEIGCGKGMFLKEMALTHPENTYLGIEKMSSVLLRAVQKAEEMEPPLNNLFFMRFDAEHIADIFGEGEVDGIYLNFSDPWPKDRHQKRRLTSREYLSRYERILAPGGMVEFKTDNEKLFDFSLEEAREKGWEIILMTRDLHHSEFLTGNVMTEYEDRFVTLGNKIMKLCMKPSSAEKNLVTGEGKD